MQEVKQRVRERMLKARKSVDPQEAREASARAASRLRETDAYRRAECVSCFVSVKDEMHTHDILRIALSESKRVGVPVVRGRKNMAMAELHDLSELRPAPFGLLEPPEESLIEIPPQQFDLVIVPGLAFDRQGYRVGYGGGFYDRFLASTRAARLGLAFDFQIVDCVPTDARDLPVDAIVTELRFIACPVR